MPPESSSTGPAPSCCIATRLRAATKLCAATSSSLHWPASVLRRYLPLASSRLQDIPTHRQHVPIPDTQNRWPFRSGPECQAEPSMIWWRGVTSRPGRTAANPGIPPPDTFAPEPPDSEPPPSTFANGTPARCPSTPTSGIPALSAPPPATPDSTTSTFSARDVGATFHRPSAPERCAIPTNGHHHGRGTPRRSASHR